MDMKDELFNWIVADNGNREENEDKQSSNKINEGDVTQ